MSEPTPRPWVDVGNGDIRGSAGELLAYCYQVDHGKTNEANAALIVRAVNSHDALVEALEAAQEELRLLRMKDTAAVYDPSLRVRIEIALAKARGEP